MRLFVVGKGNGGVALAHCVATGRLLLVGLGLWDPQDLSLRARERVAGSDVVVAEFYTARLMGGSMEDLEAVLGRRVEVLSREAVESGRDALVARAAGGTLALLVAGDPLTATTHQDLRLAALEAGLEVEIVHGASIKTAAAGLVGLSDYKFSRTTTLTLPRAGFAPESPLDVILENRARGLHTLVLLDLDAEVGRFMTASEGAQALLDLLARRRERGAPVDPDLLSPETAAAVVARAGSPAPLVTAGPLAELAARDFGPPLHALVVPGRLSEEEARVASRVTGHPFVAGP